MDKLNSQILFLTGSYPGYLYVRIKLTKELV